MAGRGNTIHDVARKAGVSISTVSKAFNNRVDLSAATRARVLAAAADLHFVPNALIRSLRRGSTKTIGVFTGWGVHDDTTHDITGRLAKGIADGMAAAGYDALHYSNMEGRSPETIAAIFLDGRIDGVIVAPTDVDDNGLNALVEFGLPPLVIYQRDVPDGVGFVSVDNHHGVQAAMDHLFALGHRRIAFYAPYFTYDYLERVESYREAHKKRRLSPDPLLCFFCRRDLSIEEAAGRLLGLPDPPTALLAADDTQAFFWLAEFARRGIAVPGQISVVGFDDVEAAAGAPGLTTVRQPAAQVGRTAVELVAGMIAGRPGSDARVVLPVEFIPRSTTARPPACG
ncbi:MAG TPA: LacI family DNA-binding transcriptional regulator [Capsulimonadaceae bacterium]|nr:LacI family DNA-binding transcriptional regulator [Capsulimonadaceae bacterium]